MTSVPEDGGDQPARTLLAWRRTALSLVATGVLTGHLAVDRTGVVVVAGCLLSVAAVLAFGWSHPQRQAAVAGVALVAGVVLVGGLALATVVRG